jgi:hypothetical protein
MLQMHSKTDYHPTNAATQEYIIQYNYKYQENGEGEYFKIPSCLCHLLKLAHGRQGAIVETLYT